MSEMVTHLPDTLWNQLQEEAFVIINTIDADSGGPTSTVLSWIYAVNPATLRIAVDHRSRLVHNMHKSPLVTVTVFGEGTIYAINGRASVVQDPLEDVPFKVCCFDITIEAVRNALFYGMELVSPPQYARVQDERAAQKLDAQVLAAMKKA